MPPEMMSKLRRSLVLHEGNKHFPYVDPVGKITIGIGYNLTDRGLDDDWINGQFVKDVEYFYERLCDDFLWFSEIGEDRQVALIDMAFMGYKKFCGFTKMLSALDNKEWEVAAFEALNSKWAHQNKSRASQLAKVLLTGTYDL